MWLVFRLLWSIVKVSFWETKVTRETSGERIRQPIYGQAFPVIRNTNCRSWYRWGSVLWLYPWKQLVVSRGRRKQTSEGGGGGRRRVGKDYPVGGHWWRKTLRGVGPGSSVYVLISPQYRDPGTRNLRFYWSIIKFQNRIDEMLTNNWKRFRTRHSRSS